MVLSLKNETSGILFFFFFLFDTTFPKEKEHKTKEKAQILFCLNINVHFRKKEKKQEREGVRGIDTLRENFISRELTFQRKQIKLSFSSFTSAVTSLKFTLHTRMLCFVFITLNQN